MPIDLDQQNIDSVVLTGNNLEVFISNGNSANVDLGPLAAQGPQGPQGLVLTELALSPQSIMETGPFLTTP